MTSTHSAPRSYLRRWVVLALLGIAGVALVNSPAAQAGHFFGATYGTGCVNGNRADNNTHSFYYTDGVGTHMRAALNASRSQNYDPTDVNTVTSTDPNSSTDVVVYQLDYSDFCGFDWHPSARGAGTAAAEQCVSIVASNGRCQKAEMRFDTSFLQVYGWLRPNLACHETGHTLGLAHRTGTPASCIWSGSTYETIDQHDRDAINANY